MKTYYGFVTVEAESEEDAIRKVEEYGVEDISWSDDFEATDAQEEDMQIKSEFDGGKAR